MTADEQDGAEVLADHIRDCRPDLKGLVVMQSGSADEIVERMLAEGWTYAADTEHVAGKRIRTLQPPSQS